MTSHISVEHCANFEFYLDDLNASPVSGNKLHKLRPYLKLAEARSCRSILSFGGPYSNHLHALAWACKQHGLASTAWVRGELGARLTPTLRDCQAWGMHLQPTNRKLYRQIQHHLQTLSEPCLTSDLPFELALAESDTALVVAEGAASRLAIESLADGYRSLFTDPRFNHIDAVACATGTGATVAGLALAAPSGVKVMGVQAVAEGEATLQRIKSWRSELNNITLLEGHLGGFAKTPPELLSFIARFEQHYGIPLEPIYNGKVVYALAKSVAQGDLPADQAVLIVHTGGLQGRRGFVDQVR